MINTTLCLIIRFILLLIPFPGGFLGEAICNENGPFLLLLYFSDNNSGIVGFGPFESVTWGEKSDLHCVRLPWNFESYPDGRIMGGVTDKRFFFLGGESVTERPP